MEAMKRKIVIDWDVFWLVIAFGSITGSILHNGGIKWLTIFGLN